jgi:hypothetical protein
MPFVTALIWESKFRFSATSILLYYEGRSQSSWTHLITPSRNFVEMRWRSVFRSTSLGKRRISYNAPPTPRKRAADRWSLRNFLPRSSLFMVGKTQKSHGGEIWIEFCLAWKKMDPWNPIRTSVIQSRSRLMRFLGFSNHEKGAPRQEISKWSKVCSTCAWSHSVKLLTCKLDCLLCSHYWGTW